MSQNINEDSLPGLDQDYECLYNLVYKDWNNNLIKDYIWEDIASTLSTIRKK